MTATHTIPAYFISYLVFLVILLLGRKKRSNRLLYDDGPVASRTMLMLLHISGIILFGTVPACVSGNFIQTVFGESIPANSLPLEWTCFFVIAFLIIAPGLAEKDPGFIAGTGSGNISFSVPFILGYFLVRILFLCAYEAWFRGYLLTDCIHSFGLPVAVIINVSCYTLLHTVNRRSEMLVCIPFGALLCGLCAWQGAAWPAMVLHIAFTLSYETKLVNKINSRNKIHLVKQ